MIDGLAPLLPILVDPVRTREPAASCGCGSADGPELGLTFDRGTLAVGPCGDRRPDVTVRADPVTFLLVAYGRASQWPAMASGKLLAWGRPRGWPAPDVVPRAAVVPGRADPYPNASWRPLDGGR